MHDSGLSGRIEKRIQKSKRTYTQKQQFAELLLRNNDFLSLAHSFKSSNWDADSSDWRGFTSGWGVEAGWDCRYGTLHKHVNIRPELECLSIREHATVRFRVNQDKLLGKSTGLGMARVRPNLKKLDLPLPGGESISLIETYPWLDKSWAEFVPSPTEIIYIRIGPTIRKKDLINLWPAIAKLKKEYFGCTDRKKRSFGRALCWYDLHKDESLGKLSFGQIRNKWRSCYPKQGLPTRAAIQKGIERIEQRISRLTPLYGGFPPIFSP